MKTLPTSPVEREQALLTDPVRASREALDELLADDFLEIASTGLSFGKAAVLDRLPQEAGSHVFEAWGFTEHAVAEGIVLVTYRAAVARSGIRISSVRASLWRREASGWRMVFHQGTPLPDGATI
ncbi:nuclear transport factor 2 family protein [Lysobacter sp. A3-1-A15]|uniref:nuclear transport factor 2 family protein n=1 Tax=Novilysobacter viscosus TaxID=3098602 RepID=UPI002ED7D33E